MTLSTDTIQQMYVAYFGRPADPSGLAFYASADENTLVRSFAASPESQALYGGANGVAAINAIYQNLFNRAAEPAGLAAWTALVTSGQLSGAAIALAILRGAANGDQTTVANKIAAASAFTAHVDTTRELGGFSGATSAAVARAYLKTVDGTAASLSTALAGTDQAVLVATGGTGPASGGGDAPPPIPLTAGLDTIAGTAGNDTITSSTAGFFASGDSIDGGGGTDTLRVSGETAPITGAGITVQNVEVANLSTTGAITLNTTGWTGLTSLTTSGTGANAVAVGAGVAVNATVSALGAQAMAIDGGSSVTVNASGISTGQVTVGGTTAPTGAVLVNSSASIPDEEGNITITGGTSVNVVQTASNAVNTRVIMAIVTVTGTALTTAVTINSAAGVQGTGTAAVTDNSVTVTDVNFASGTSTNAGTIGSVSIANYSSATISDNALTTLSVAGGTGGIVIHNASALASGSKTTTLNLTVNGLTNSSALTDDNIYTTLNLTTAGADSKLASITDSALTTLNISGTKALTLSATSAMSTLATVKVSGAAGLTADLSAATVTSIDVSTTSGNNTLVIDATKIAYIGGSGADVIILASGLTKAIDLGAGDDSLAIGTIVPSVALAGGLGTDTLSMAVANAISASTTSAFAGLVTGFEQLTLTNNLGAVTTQHIDLAMLGGYSTVQVPGGGIGLVLDNFASNGTLILAGAGTAYTLANTAFAGGSEDRVNLKLTDKSAAFVNFASGGITAIGVENFNITTVDGQITPSGTFNDLITLLGNDAKTITIGGNAGISLTAASTALTSVDASGITGATVGGFRFTSGTLAGAATIKGSATGTNSVTFSAATAAVTYVGGSGTDTITFTNAQNNNIALGDGDNSVDGGNGNNTITGGSGSNGVTLGSGNNNINLGNGGNAVTVTTGSNTITTGTGNDAITIGASAGVNTVNVGSGTDGVTLKGIQTTSANLTVVTGMGTGDTFDFNLTKNGHTLFTQTSLGAMGATQADLPSYLNAAAIGDGATAHTLLSWFQFNGNTYIVHDTSAASTFVNGSDSVIELVGLVNLATSTVNFGVVTI